MAGLFLAGAVIFVVVRALLIPSDFGELGHFRTGAIHDNTLRPFSFAGHEMCESCHDDVLEAKAGGKHGMVNCEACHGPLAAHAEDASVAPTLPVAVSKLCLRCHSYSLSRPKDFPQVVEEEHSGGDDCDSCHEPHHPDF